MKNKRPQKIILNHLGYTVTILDIKTAKDDVLDLIQSQGARAVAKERDRMNSEIYLSFPLKHDDYATIGHEIIHVMQYISRSRGMDFIGEMEHFAYIFHYIFNEIRGYYYTLPK